MDYQIHRLKRIFVGQRLECACGNGKIKKWEPHPTNNAGYAVTCQCKRRITVTASGNYVAKKRRDLGLAEVTAILVIIALAVFGMLVHVIQT